jgi:hypothetical protein
MGSVALASLAGASIAQVGLPGVKLDLPKVGLPGEAAIDAPPARARVDARHLRIQALVRRHPESLATDTHGELAVRDQVLAQPSSDALFKSVLARGSVVESETRAPELDLVVAVIRPPPGTGVSRALAELRKLDPEGRYDYHHVLSESGGVPETAPAAASDRASADTAGLGVRVGMIDGGVLPAHAALSGITVNAHGCAGRIEPSAHGTAVASLLVESLGVASSNAARPSVELYADDVYCNEPTGGAIGAVIDALAWLAHENVDVINVSLVGPSNAVLERVVARMVTRGHLIVAAVGNDGPAAPPLYPAAYDGVIGVTGVDHNGHVLLEAGRGPAVDFAALGSDVDAANLTGARAVVRGTSFAAPVVAAALALRVQALSRAAAGTAVASLASTAIDLGARGRDPVYGYGWVRSRSTSASASTHEVMSHPEVPTKP